MLSLTMSFPILIAMLETLKLKPVNGVGIRKEPAGCICEKVVQDQRLICALIAVFVVQSGDQTLDVLLPYTSKRFKLSLSQAC